VSRTMAIVWPCQLGVDEYVAAGRMVAVPRQPCPGCSAPLAFRSGYERSVRVGGRCVRVWVRRGACRSCSTSHALLPSFLLRWRLDVVTVIGEALATVAGGVSGVRPVAARLEVPHTTARDWVRRFRTGAEVWAAALGAAVVELAGFAPHLPVEPCRAAVAATGWVWAAVRARAGPSAPGRWPLISLITGGRLLAAAIDPPWLMLGDRRLMPPVP
jgi:Domain of unknown function (DUF6431)